MQQSIRIEAARAALARAAWTRGDSPTYSEDAVIDLLADIRQLCRAAGYDFTRCVQLSRHYTADNGGAS